MDPLRRGVSVCQSRGKIRSGGRDAQHPAAGGDKLPVRELVPGVVDGDAGPVQASRVDDLNELALLIRSGISARGQDHAAGGRVLELDGRLTERAAGAGLHDGQQVGLQKGQNGLRLRVAEAAVVLDDLTGSNRDALPCFSSKALTFSALLWK